MNNQKIYNNIANLISDLAKLKKQHTQDAMRLYGDATPECRNKLQDIDIAFADFIENISKIKG